MTLSGVNKFSAALTNNPTRVPLMRVNLKFYTKVMDLIVRIEQIKGLEINSYVGAHLGCSSGSYLQSWGLICSKLWRFTSQHSPNHARLRFSPTYQLTKSFIIDS